MTRERLHEQDARIQLALARWRAGDSDGGEAIVRETARLREAFVRRVARRHCLQPADADDLRGELLLALAQLVRTFQLPSPAGAFVLLYLRRCKNRVNQFLDRFYNKQRRWLSLELPPEADESGDDEPDNVLDIEFSATTSDEELIALRTDVLRALSDLAVRGSAEAFVRALEAGCSVQEAARWAGLCATSVRRRLRKLAKEYIAAEAALAAEAAEVAGRDAS